MSRSLLLVLALAAAGSGLTPVAHGQAPEALRVADPSGTQRLRLDTRGGLVVSGAVYPDAATIPASGAGARLMWWPEMAAFRVGVVDGTQWDAANVGVYSTALGRNTTASGYGSTAMGLYTTASGYGSTAMGLYTTGSGFFSTSLGYFTTASGDLSTALGARASANGQQGAFVVGDSSTSTLMASAPNQYSTRFAGGYRLFTNSAMTVGAQLPPGATSWSTLSDSTRKAGFRPYDGDAVLAGLARLRLGTWHYRGQDPATQRHWGPMAQDFYREFGHDGVGTVGSDTLIATADADGVLFAAAQALEARTRELTEAQAALAARVAEVEALRTEVAALRAEAADVASLRADLARLGALVARLDAEARPAALYGSHK